MASTATAMAKVGFGLLSLVLGFWLSLFIAVGRDATGTKKLESSSFAGGGFGSSAAWPADARTGISPTISGPGAEGPMELFSDSTGGDSAGELVGGGGGVISWIGLGPIN